MTVIAGLCQRVEEGLAALFPDDAGLPTSWSEMRRESIAAHRHPLLAGGKRIRPLLTLLSAGTLSEETGLCMAMPAALAVELVHTYSLVHDDLPCMDNDDFRRGKPTTHKVFGEAKGLLAGDGLLTQAFSIMANAPLQLRNAHPDFNLNVLSLSYCLAARMLSDAAGADGMVLGQWLDVSERELAQDWNWVEKVAREKTGRLLGASLEMGVLLGVASFAGDESLLLSDQTMNRLAWARECGIHAGIAFQCIDDVLDVISSNDEMGKTVGKDAAQGKVTSVSLFGVGGARQKALEHTELSLDSFHRLCTCTSRSDLYCSLLEQTILGLLDRRV